MLNPVPGMLKGFGSSMSLGDCASYTMFTG